MKKFGFSLVEIMVVIVVIALLATMMVFFVSNWRTDAAETEVKNDLLNAASAVEDYKNFNATYPTSQSAFDALYNNTETVTLQYTYRSPSSPGSSAGSFCINARSTERTSVRWYIDLDVGSTPRAGTC